jgi:hypothetical protein
LSNWLGRRRRPVHRYKLWLIFILKCWAEPDITERSEPATKSWVFMLKKLVLRLGPTAEDLQEVSRRRAKAWIRQ